MEWVLSERHSVNKDTGKQRTQLELGVSTLHAADVAENDIPAQHMLHTCI